MSGPLVGVLALQGDVREHATMLGLAGARSRLVRRPDDLNEVDGLVLPGGESTTIARLARIFGLLVPIRDRLTEGLPALGTCAGMILLARTVLDGTAGQETFGVLDISVRRNAFGRQVDSWEGPVRMKGIDSDLHGVFIRAPWVEAVGDDVEVLACSHDHPVAVRSGRALATAFHPEVDGPQGPDPRLHRMFVDQFVRTTAG